MIRISIVAPGIAVRAGLRALLGEDPQLDVVAEASSLNEWNDRIQETDVLVWSPGTFPDQEAVIKELDQVKLPASVAVLLIFDDPAALETMRRLSPRAWGQLSSEASQMELIAGVQAVNLGLTVIHPMWVNQVIKAPESEKVGNGKNIEELTNRELEILQLLALGLTNKQIALRLKISAHTVKFHISTIFSKLGTTNRVEAINLGLKKGLIVL